MRTAERVYVRTPMGLMGIAFVILSIAVAFTAPPLPTTAAPALEVQRYFAEHGWGFMVGNYVGVLAMLPGLPFFAYTAYRLKVAEGEDGWLWLVSLLAGGVAHAAGAIDLALFQVAAIQTDPALAKLANDLADMCFGVLFVPFVVCTWVITYASFTVGGFSKFSGISGAVVGALCLVASVGMMTLTGPLAIPGPITGGAFLLYILWNGVLAIDILRGPASTP